jgi:hypothetical protein
MRTGRKLRKEEHKALRDALGTAMNPETEVLIESLFLTWMLNIAPRLDRELQVTGAHVWITRVYRELSERIYGQLSEDQAREAEEQGLWPPTEWPEAKALSAGEEEERPS